MWQRHTQPLAFSGTSLYSAAGCGSWTRHTSQPPDSSRAFISLYCAPGRPLLLVEVLRRALQRVVHQLGRVEELFAAVDHLPLAVQADVAHQRHERVEDLRDAAAERGRRDVHDALALQRLGQLADFRDQLAPADVRVVGERLVADGDGLEHAAGTIPNAGAVIAAQRRRDAASNYGLGDAQRAPLPSGLRAVPARAGRRRLLARRPRPRRCARRSRPTPSKARARSPNCERWPRASRPAPRQRRRRGARRATSRTTLRGLGGDGRRRLLGPHAPLRRRRRSTASGRSRR